MARMPAKPLTDWAADAAIDPLYVEAVVEVESGGRALHDNGDVVKRFEPHHFPDPERIGFTGGWRDSLALTKARREEMFARAVQVDLEATYDATSWGAPQIMGFNAEDCGYGSAVAMANAFRDPYSQALAFTAFLERYRGGRLMPALRAKDSLEFARLYNGPANAAAYAAKINSAYARITGKEPPKILRLGNKGPAVRKLQKALVLAGFTDLKVDGVFGPDTANAVRDFQDGECLAIDGLVGAATWAALDRAGAIKDAPLAKGKTDLNLDLLAKMMAGAAAVITAATPLAEEVVKLPPPVLYAALATAGACAVIVTAAMAFRFARARS